MDYGASMERRTAFCDQRRLGVSALTSKVHARGFTLLEALVAAALAALLIGFAIPSFIELNKNQRLVTAANELLVSLSLARSVSLTTRAPTVVCRSSNATQPNPVCGAGSSWHEGWIVFSDNNANGIYEAATEQLWEQHSPLIGKLTINSGGNADPFVRFSALGTVPGFNSTFQICDDRKSDGKYADRMRQVVLAFSGRAQVRHGIGGTACK